MISVEAGEFFFTSVTEGNETIKAQGVSPGLCLCFYGQNRKNNTPFIGMYHWLGFNTNVGNNATAQEEVVNEEIYSLAKRARAHFKAGTSKDLIIHAFLIMGGEKRQVGEDGQLILSGTEREVETLKAHGAKLCALYFTTTENTTFNSINYLTTGNQYLDITMMPTETTCTTHVVPEEEVSIAIEENNDSADEQLQATRISRMR